MSIFLFCVGAIAFLAGVVMAGFGIPVSEFSFGNTLISAGATTAMGGLIVIGLGAVVSKLQLIAEGLATQAPIRPGRPLDMYEAAAGSRAAAAAAPGRIPFPVKPKPKASMREPQPLEPRAIAPAPSEPIEDQPAQSFTPTFAPALRNPDEPPMTVEDDVSLSPQHPMAAPRPAIVDRGEAERPASPVSLNEPERVATRDEPMLDAGWRSPPPPFPSQSQSASPQTRQHSSYFDTMWPPETRTPRASAVGDAKAEPELELPPPEEAIAPVPHEEPEAPPPANEPRAVAILKSGVVDGMAYKLYVDGSIEAELPQGTLRFASINELRSHLEKNS